MDRSDIQELEKISKDITQKVMKELKKINDFEINNSNIWKKPLHDSQIFLIFNYNFGDELNRTYSDMAIKKDDYLFDVLRKMHAKGCLVSSEILTLLKSGFAEGAMARWRSLYEISVLSSFIKDNGIETAKRFLEHDNITRYKWFSDYEYYREKLNEDKLGEEQEQDIIKKYNNVLEKYGKNFKYKYGWASHIKNNNGKIISSFYDICKTTELDKYIPYYKLSSEGIHSSARGISFNLGNPSSDIILAGRSSFGISWPGQLMIISLGQISTIFASYKSNNELKILLKMITEKSEKIQEEYSKVESEMEM